MIGFSAEDKPTTEPTRLDPYDVTRAEIGVAFNVAAALERPILDGRPATELFAMLAKMFDPQMWPDLREPEATARAKVHAHLQARATTTPTPVSDKGEHVGYYL